MPKDPSKLSDEKVVLSAKNVSNKLLHQCLIQVPGAIAINNHMGSAFSENKEAVRKLIQGISKLSLPFIDSRTTAKSHFCKETKKRKLSCLERDVFLDDPLDAATVAGRIKQSVEIAKARGWAIAIGHPDRETLMALKRFGTKKSAVQTVSLSQLLERIGVRD